MRVALTSLSALFAAAVMAAASPALAQPANGAARERLQQMTPEQRAEMREKMRQKWESMTPEQREAAKKRMAERHPDAGKRVQERARQGAPAGPVAPAASAAH